MARFMTTVESTLPQEAAFDYMADFSNTRLWDPSVSRADRLGDGPIGTGSAFGVVTRFAGRDLELQYEIVEYDPPRRVVLEARRPGLASRDTITVDPTADGSVVRYDAQVLLSGARRLLDPLVQRVFDRVGAKAEAGMRSALNP
jgi:hypothetical protein